MYFTTAASTISNTTGVLLHVLAMGKLLLGSLFVM
jgi:hypothetical protein